MAQSTSPDFYNAADYYGVDHFPDAQSAVAAELSLMLRSARANNPDARLRREDLVGYHFLHFGSDPQIVAEAIENCFAGVDNMAWTTEAREHLDNTIIEAEPSWMSALPVGRIALDRTTEVDPLIQVNLRKTDKFLYPNKFFLDDVAMYLGRNSFDHDTTMYLGPDRFEYDKEKINIDSIKIEGRYVDTLVQAISTGVQMLKITQQRLPRTAVSSV